MEVAEEGGGERGYPRGRVGVDACQDQSLSGFVRCLFGGAGSRVLRGLRVAVEQLAYSPFLDVSF